MSIGPVDYMVVGFPGNKFRGEIVPELRKLVENGTIRIIDLVFVRKDSEGTISAAELSALDPSEASAFDSVEGEVDDLLNEEDLALAAEQLEPNSSGAILVWENTWATGVADAIARADGQLVAFERIPRDIVQAALSAQAS